MDEYEYYIPEDSYRSYDPDSIEYNPDDYESDYWEDISDYDDMIDDYNRYLENQIFGDDEDSY